MEKTVDKVVVGAENVTKVATGTKHVNTYTPRAKGFPMQPGETWHDMTMEQRKQWFADHENKWKRKFQTDGARNGMQSSLSLSRG